MQILLLIGETLECTDDITGCFISSRKSTERVAVWFSTFEPRVIDNLRDAIKAQLADIPIEIKVERHNSPAPKKGR